MATAFDRWAKDPFFYAAEEVQESADRMESAYRRWMHEKSAVELRREVHTSLGTAKWQLEELEKAVRRSDESVAAGEDTVARHTDFVAAIRSKVFMVEGAVKEAALEKESDGLGWVRLDEGERDELAAFLAGSDVCATKSEEIREDRMKGHRRVASAFADLGVWKIAVDSEEESVAKLLDEQKPNLPPPRIVSFSELGTAESGIKSKWYRNGFRKWKVVSHEDLEESIPLQNHHLCRGMNACYEKSKSCIGDFTDDSSNKQLYGCLGACQRQIQRSQYQIQYGRPIQMIVWTAVTVMLIVFFVLRVT